MRGLVVGKALTLLVGLAALVLYGSPTVALTAVMFGLLASTIQYVAGRIQSKVPKDADFATFAKGWGTGMGLRTLGVAVLAVVCSLWPERFPPVGAAIGYLGVLIPLLFLETRTAR